MRSAVRSASVLFFAQQYARFAGASSVLTHSAGHPPPVQDQLPVPSRWREPLSGPIKNHTETPEKAKVQTDEKMRYAHFFGRTPINAFTGETNTPDRLLGLEPLHAPAKPLGQDSQKATIVPATTGPR
jgi:hypothetical protein